MRRPEHAESEPAPEVADQGRGVLVAPIINGPVLRPPLLVVLVVLSLSFVHVGLGADREGVGFKITLRSGEHPVSSEFYSYKQHGP